MATAQAQAMAEAQAQEMVELSNNVKDLELKIINLAASNIILSNENIRLSKLLPNNQDYEFNDNDNILIIKNFDSFLTDEIKNTKYNLLLKLIVKEIFIYSGIQEIPSNFLNAFTECERITISSSITKIKDRAFNGMKKITSVVFIEPSSLDEIGLCAFQDLISLTSLTIPNSVTTINPYAFKGMTSLTSLTLSNRVRTIGANAFENLTSLTSLTIPNSLTTIENSVFKGMTSLTSLTIPNYVTTIGVNAFENLTSLTSLKIPDSVTTIGYYAFKNTCILNGGLIIPNSVKTIGMGSFMDCKAKTLSIGSSLTRIEMSVFRGMELTSLTIPSNIIYIENSAFSSNNIAIINFQEPCSVIQIVFIFNFYE